MSGGLTASFSGGKTLSFDREVTWIGSDTLSLGFQLLVSDGAYQHFWNTSAGVGEINDGATGSASFSVPTPVPTYGNLTESIVTTGLPSSLGMPATNVQLNYPGVQATANLPRTVSTSLVTGVPNIIGATLYASAVVSQANEQAAASARALPLSTSSLTLTLHAPPTIQSPGPGEALSVTHGTVSWTPTTTKNVALVGFLMVGDGGIRDTGAVVLTSDSSVSMERLARLGVQVETTASSRVAVNLAGQISSLDAMLDETVLAKPDGSQSARAVVDGSFTP